jgi:hypothetical protein
MGFGREDSESGTLVLGSDLVVSELLSEFGPGYHFSDRRSSSPIFNRSKEFTGISRTARFPSWNYRFPRKNRYQTRLLEILVRV